MNWQWAGESPQGIAHVRFGDLGPGYGAVTTLSGGNGRYDWAVVTFDVPGRLPLPAVLHEFGHVGGLGHAGTGLMGGSQASRYQPGDLEGLREVGC